MENIRKYEEILKKTELELEEELKSTPVIKDYGDDIDHGEEEADESISADDQAAVIDSIRNHIEEVRMALVRMENETYGKCEKCGEDIETEVLDLVPESRYCRKDKMMM